VHVAVGSRDELEAENGLAHFCEHMVFRGTKKLPTRDDTSVLEGLGAIQNGWTYSESTCYFAKLPHDKWELGLEVQKELALNPLFRDKDLESEKGVVIEEINKREDAPDELVWEVVEEMRFPNQAVGRSTLGKAEVIRSATGDQIRKFHSKYLNGGKILVAVAGKLDEQERVKEKIEVDFGSLSANEKTLREEPKFSAGAQVKVINKPNTQVNLLISFDTFALGDKRRYVLKLIDNILGSGLSSRLFRNVRDRLGLAYSIGSDYSLEVDHGSFSVYAGVSPDKLELAVGAIMAELNLLKTEGVLEQELVAAKEKFRGPMMFAMENPYNQMQYYAKCALWLPEAVMTPEEDINAAMGVKTEEILQLAHELFVPAKAKVAIVGPVASDKEAEVVKLLYV
jgi:predicted Zn-dependent peptidase